MIVTINDAKQKIAELKKQTYEYQKLQDYALGLDLPIPRDSKLADRRSALSHIKTEANLECDIRTLATMGIELCEAEINRIQNIIDNTKINI